jgi:hypothetical protein
VGLLGGKDVKVLVEKWSRLPRASSSRKSEEY